MTKLVLEGEASDVELQVTRVHKKRRMSSSRRSGCGGADSIAEAAEEVEDRVPAPPDTERDV